VGSKRSRRGGARDGAASVSSSESTARHTRGTGSFDEAEVDRSVRARLSDLAVASDSGGEGHDGEDDPASDAASFSVASVFGSRTMDRSWALPPRLRTDGDGCTCATVDCHCGAAAAVDAAAGGLPALPSGSPLLSPHLSFSLSHASAGAAAAAAPASPTDSARAMFLFPPATSSAVTSSALAAAAVVPPTSIPASTWSTAEAPHTHHAHAPPAQSRMHPAAAVASPHALHAAPPTTTTSSAAAAASARRTPAAGHAPHPSHTSRPSAASLGGSRGAHTSALPLTPHAGADRRASATRVAAIALPPAAAVLECGSGCGDDEGCHAAGGGGSVPALSVNTGRRMPRALSPTSRFHDVDLRVAAAVGAGGRGGCADSAVTLSLPLAPRRRPDQPLIAEAEADDVRSAVLVLAAGFRHAAIHALHARDDAPPATPCSAPAYGGDAATAAVAAAPSPASLSFAL
jgi:hypothetical protein